MAAPRYDTPRGPRNGHQSNSTPSPTGQHTAKVLRHGFTLAEGEQLARTATTALDLDRPAAAAQRVALLPGPLDGWETRAACRWVVTGPETDVFYGQDGEPHPETRERQRRAKRICARCPVRLHCLQRALETWEPHGIWGGLTARERRDLPAKEGIRLPKHHRREAVGGGW